MDAVIDCATIWWVGTAINPWQVCQSEAVVFSGYNFRNGVINSKLLPPYRYCLLIKNYIVKKLHRYLDDLLVKLMALSHDGQDCLILRGSVSGRDSSWFEILGKKQRQSECISNPIFSCAVKGEGCLQSVLLTALGRYYRIM